MNSHRTSALGRTSRPRAFTLVELLVAMAAGLMVSMAAFLLSKNATRFFQNEARASASHLSALLGLNRLTADIQRAGFLSSANVLRDPFMCAPGYASAWPNGMRRLAGVAIKRAGSVIDHPGQLAQSTANRFSPDSIIIGGSFNTTEQFRYNAVVCTDVACDIEIDVRSGAMQRALARVSASGESLEDIFRPGRFLRVLPEGDTKYMIGLMDDVDIDPVNTPPTFVRLRLSPPASGLTPLPWRDEFQECGVRRGPNGSGGVVNPISRVRYDLRSLSGHTTYGPLVAPISPAMTGDNGRTELVRVELDAENNEIPETLELVSEYAVDLKLGISVATENPDPLIKDPTITRHPITMPDNANVYTIGADITEIGAAPQRIRAVQVRFAARARAPDRDVDLTRSEDGLPRGPDGRKVRFLIPGILPAVTNDTDPIPPGSPPLFARMRTFYTEVALPNQANILW